MKIGVGCAYGQEVVMVRQEAKSSNGIAPWSADLAGVDDRVERLGGAPVGRDVRLSPAVSDFHTRRS